jgi:hypothetical protein
MADLELEYVVGFDSVSQRAAAIVLKKTLDPEDVVDHSNDLDPPYVGQFGLEYEFFIRVDKVVAEMQSLLTCASSLIGRESHFIIDPCRDVMHTL